MESLVSGKLSGRRKQLSWQAQFIGVLEVLINKQVLSLPKWPSVLPEVRRGFRFAGGKERLPVFAGGNLI